MTAPPLVVRAAVPADAAAMAALHVHAWRAAYAGVMPADFLAALTIAEREAMWRRSVTEPELAPAERECVTVRIGAYSIMSPQRKSCEATSALR